MPRGPVPPQEVVADRDVGVPLLQRVVLSRGRPGHQTWLRQPDRGLVGGGALVVVERALARGEVLELQPLQPRLDLRRARLLVEHIAVAAEQGALAAVHRGDREVLVRAAELLDDEREVVGRGQIHAELAAAHHLLDVIDDEQLLAAHGTIAPAHGLELLQDGMALWGVDGGLLAVGADHIAALGVHLGGEVPPALVAGAVVGVADVSVTEVRDPLGGGPDLVPGGRWLVGVEARLREERAVWRHAVDAAAGLLAVRGTEGPGAADGGRCLPVTATRLIVVWLELMTRAVWSRHYAPHLTPVYATRSLVQIEP